MQRLLAFAVRYATGTVIVALIVVYVIFSIHGSRNLGVIFFNENDPQWANIFVRAQGNLSPEESYSLVTEVEDELNQVVGLWNINMISTAGLGQAEGTRVEFSGGSSADIIGIFYIEMTPSDQRERTGTEILEEIRERVSGFNGVVIEVVPISGALTPGKPIALQFTSPDREALTPVVERVKDYMLNEVEGLRDLEDTSTTRCPRVGTLRRSRSRRTLWGRRNDSRLNSTTTDHRSQAW